MPFRRNTKQKEKTYKQVILVRTDLKMGKGKVAAQVSHASVEAVLGSNSKIVSLWKKQGMKKVVLKVKDEKELLSYKREADSFGLKAVLIKDAGRTQIKPGSVTVLGIGPDESEKIDQVTSGLKIL